MDAARDELFKYAERPAGYPAFLRAVHLVTFDYFPATIVLQHLLGIASGLLVYATVRRLGASRPLALVPTAVVLLGGDLIFFTEHAVLSEALFTFLLTAALYAAVRALDERPALWAAGAGVLWPAPEQFARWASFSFRRWPSGSCSPVPAPGGRGSASRQRRRRAPPWCSGCTWVGRRPPPMTSG